MKEEASGTGPEAAAAVFGAAVGAVLPEALLGPHLERLRGAGGGGFVVAAVGKAAARMAAEAVRVLGSGVLGGAVITKHGHAAGIALPPRLALAEAGHPVPDEGGLRAAVELERRLSGLGGKDTVLCLLSGGASALMPAPWPGISLAAKQAVTGQLLRSGAEIGELNAVRKHLSRLKGGRLAAAAAPARVVSLIISDVIGDPLDVIASGPTAPDPTTFADALAVLERRGVLAGAPPEVVGLLRRGAAGEVPETPKPGDSLFLRVENSVIGGNDTALAAAEREAARRCGPVRIVARGLSGEARDAARTLAAAALAEPAGGARCLLAGGETTVTVRGSGKGGRNTELALVFALEVAGRPGITLLSGGTDGTDGPTDGAGAVVTGETVPRARAAGLDPERFLAENDSYEFFRRAGGLLLTGPTGTNVMDVQVVVLGDAPPLEGPVRVAPAAG